MSQENWQEYALVLQRKVKELEGVVDQLTHHGNGEVIRNWTLAHGKAMDQLKATEEKLKQAQATNHRTAYRAGYRDGATAVNTVGPDALGHVEMHLNKWMGEI